MTAPEIVANAMLSDAWTESDIARFGMDNSVRLDRIGIPPELAWRLGQLRVPLLVLEKIAYEHIPWSVVVTCLNGPGLASPQDANALLGLWDVYHGQPGPILHWAALGPLEAAFRLTSKNVQPDLAAQFPLSDEHTLEDLLKMFRAAERQGIHHDDVPLWFMAGVLTLDFPHIAQSPFQAWRRTAVHGVGWRRAALGAAAGLSPSETVTQVENGEFDEDSLRVLVGFRRLS